MVTVVMIVNINTVVATKYMLFALFSFFLRRAIMHSKNTGK